MRKLQLVALIVLGLLGQGCDTSGVHPLNSPIDLSENCAKSTWMRTTDTSTELFLFGETDPTTVVGGEGTCFVRAVVQHDSSAVVEQGRYTLDATGAGRFEIDQVYSFQYQPNIRPLDRDGAKVEDNPMPDAYDITVAADAQEVLFGLNGELRRLTNIYDVIARLDPTTQAGADDIYRMYNLSLFTSQVRVLSFGGAGMTQYLNSKKEFQALVDGSFTVLVQFPLAVTTISYLGYEDLNGIRIEGDQITKVNSKGDGGMEGALAWEMRLSDDPEDVFLSGTLDYKDCLLTSGVASGGFYGLTIDGHPSYQVSYELAADADMSTLLPPSTP